MNNSKKTNRAAAAALASSMILASISIPAVSAAAPQELTAMEKFQALKDKGVFSGREGGDAALDATMTRAEMATVLVKLFNLTPVTDANTFKDTKAHWAQKFIEAVAKAGYMSGTGNGKFEPNSNITTQELASVLVRALGLKADGSVTVSDKVSAWASKAVETALENKLIPQSADYTTPAKRDALVSASYNVYINQQIAVKAAVAVDATHIRVTFSDNVSKDYTLDKALAPNVETAQQVTYNGKNYDVKVTFKSLNVATVTASANRKVVVALNEAASNVDASRFSIKDSSGKALNVLSLKTSADQKTITLTTDGQTVGQRYTLSVDGNSFEFVGQLLDIVKPEVTFANALTNNLVEVTFSEDMDEDAALNPSYYNINDLQVQSVAFKDGSKNVVELTTAPQTSSKLYTLQVAYAMDVQGNIINADKRVYMFGGKGADVTKPTMSSFVTAYSGNKVLLSFTDENKLDEASLLSAGNYTIAGLVVTSARIVKNEVGLSGVKQVELTTADQIANQLYYVTVSNVRDAVGNVMDNAQVPFGGSAKDTTKLAIESVVADTNNTVRVQFNDVVDPANALNPANYTIDGLTVTKVAEDKDATALTSPYEYQQKSVYVVTTSDQSPSTLYYLKTKNLTDKVGNPQEVSELSVPFGGAAKDVTKPVAASVSPQDKNHVVVTFIEAGGLDKASAENPSSYYFDGGLGYATKAVLSGNTVTLTTSTQESSKTYNLNVSGVKDKAGNANDATKLTFIGKGDADNVAPKVQSVVALDKNTLQVVFSKPVANATTAADYFISASTKSGYPIGSVSGKANSVVLLADNKTALVTFSSNPFDYGYVYSLTVLPTSATNISNINDTTQPLNTANSSNVVQFAGSSAVNVGPVLSAVIAVDATHVKAVFSEPVDAAAAQSSKLNIVSRNGAATDSALGGAMDFQSISADGKEVTYYLSGLPSALASDTIFKAFVTDVQYIKDVTNVTSEANSGGTAGVGKAGVQFAKNTAQATAAKIDYIYGVDAKTVDVYFNKPVKVGGAYEYATDTNQIAVTDQNGIALSSAINFDHAVVSSDNPNVVRMYFKTNSFEAGKVYTLTVADATLIKDLDGNNLSTVSDGNKRMFAASGAEQAKVAIAGAEAVAFNKVRVTFNQPLNSLISASDVAGDLEIKFGSTVLNAQNPVLATDKKSIMLTLTDAVFSQDDEYSVAIKTAVKITNVPGAGASVVDTSSNVRFRGLFSLSITANNATLTNTNDTTTENTTQTVTVNLSDGRPLANGVLLGIAKSGADQALVNLTSPVAVTTTTLATYALTGGIGTFALTAEEAGPATAAGKAVLVSIGINGTSYTKSITVSTVRTATP